MKDFLLDDDNALTFTGGDLEIGGSEMQDVALIIQTQQGDWKNDPVTGLGLTRYIKSKESGQLIERDMKIQLARDGKNYTAIKNKIEIKYRTS